MYIYGNRYRYGTKYFENTPPGFLGKSGFWKMSSRVKFGHFFNQLSNIPNIQHIHKSQKLFC